MEVSAERMDTAKRRSMTEDCGDCCFEFGCRPLQKLHEAFSASTQFASAGESSGPAP